MLIHLLIYFPFRYLGSTWALYGVLLYY